MANEVRTGVHNALAYNVIDYVHQENHKGRVYDFDTYFQTIANNGSSHILMVTSTTREVHVYHFVSTVGPTLFRLYEGVTVQASSVGTLSPSFNKNRNFTTSAGTVFYVGANMTNGLFGTRILDRLIVGNTGGGTGVNTRLSAGGNENSAQEWILKPNTQYLYSFISTCGTINEGINFKLDFYEE
jgi:hypothetical protein